MIALAARIRNTVRVETIRLEVHHHFDSDTLRLVSRIFNQLEHVMASISDLDAAVDQLVAEVSTVGQLLDLIHQELTDALANANDPAAIQSVLDKVSAARQALQDAETRDADPTPPAP